MIKRAAGALLLVFLCLLALYAGAEILPYAQAREGFANLPREEADIVLSAKDYTSSENMEDIEILEDGSLFTGASGSVSFTVSVPRDALYSLFIRYFPGGGTGGDIERAVYINGELPFEEAEDIVFSRMWNDVNRDYQKATGNQPFPSQVQTPEWMTAACKDPIGYETEPFLFPLTAGENTITLVSVREEMLIDTITLSAEQSLPTYDEYLAAHLSDGAQYIDCEARKIQAEDAALKSSPSLYPINDRTSPLSEPYDASNIILNCIGGTAWNEPGEWIAWDIEAPESGLYRILLRFKQSDLRGLYAARMLRVNGEIPFREAADLRFYYSTSFQLTCLSENRDNPNDAAVTREYWFYLNKGTNRVSLEVALGDLGDILRSLESCTAKLNELYRQVIAITGTSPDIYRDYQLFVRLPSFKADVAARIAELNDIYDRLTALTGSGSERTSGITRLLAIMETFSRGSEEIVKKLSSFKECVTAMGKSVLDLKDQPMKIDYIMLLGTQTPSLQAEGNFFQMAGHTVSAFIGSFFNDYNVVSSEQKDTGKTIEVWLSTGRDQFEVIRRLINESFEPGTGVKVSLKLINADALLPSTFTGRGPDIAIQIGNTAPVNFAFRGAAYDLSTFDDFDKVIADFLPAAMESFYYKGGCYALPDQMSFPVMYYRKDILSALGLKVPDTWEELISLIPELQQSNMEIYLDTAPVTTLGAALSMGNSKPINTIFLSRLYQTGGDIYTEDGSACDFLSETANAAFKWWTQFYTQHGFPREIDFVTRFRIGEVPIGIVDLSTYTRLSVSAPEIRGDWAIAQVPGTYDENGVLQRDIPCVTGAAMIIKNSVERKDTAEEAWSFLKWWTGAETQSAFAREMEAVLGPAGRYPVANLTAFETISWSQDTRNVLNEALKTLHGIPQVPGGYITGRYLDNAFVTVITDYENASDTLYENTLLINEEITNKRKEFGLE